MGVITIIVLVVFGVFTVVGLWQMIPPHFEQWMEDRALRKQREGK